MAKAPTDANKKPEAVASFDTKPTAAVQPQQVKAKEAKSKAEPKEPVLIKKEGDEMPALSATDLPGYEITETTLEEISAVMLEKLISTFRFRIRNIGTDRDQLFNNVFSRIEEAVKHNRDKIKFFKATSPTNGNTIFFDSDSILVSDEGSMFSSWDTESEFGDSERDEAGKNKNRHGDFSLFFNSQVKFEKLQGVNLICSTSAGIESRIANSVVVPNDYSFTRYGSKDHAFTFGRAILSDSIIARSQNKVPTGRYSVTKLKRCEIVDSHIPASVNGNRATIVDCSFDSNDGKFHCCTLTKLKFSSFYYDIDRGPSISFIGSRRKQLILSNSDVLFDTRNLHVPKQDKASYGDFFEITHPMHLAVFKNAFIMASVVSMARTAKDGMVITIQPGLRYRENVGIYVSQQDSVELIRAKVTAGLKEKEIPLSENEGFTSQLQLAPITNKFDPRHDEPLQRTIDSMTDIIASRLNVYRMMSQLNVIS